MAARYHHGDLHASLLAATRDLVRRAGPSAVTLRDVARRAGVSEAAPYHHFANKAELLLATAASGFAVLEKRLRAAAEAATSARTRMVALAAAYVAFAIDEPGYFRLLFGAHIAELTAEPSPAVAEAKKQGKAAAMWLREGVAAFLAETKITADQRELERVVWAQLHGTAWLVSEREITPQPSRAEALALAERGIELVLAGLKPKARSRRLR